MEAIKFSELPTGDRMTLQDEDGMPIIANGENRLLSWGRLKDQLAKQTHTDTVKNDETKVPTAAAVEKRVGECEDNLRSDLTTLSEVANQAHEKANNAALAASNAQATADGAKADAARFESELDGKIGAITAAQGQLRTDLETETTNREAAINEINTTMTATTTKLETVEAQLTETSNTAADAVERVSNIETKIENGEIGGGGEEVDLTSITERLTALETANTNMTEAYTNLLNTINDLESKITSANTRCTQLNANVNTLLNEISTQLEEIA